MGIIDWVHIVLGAVLMQKKTPTTLMYPMNIFQDSNSFLGAKHGHRRIKWLGQGCRVSLCWAWDLFSSVLKFYSKHFPSEVLFPPMNVVLPTMKYSPQGLKQMVLYCEWVQKAILVTTIGYGNSKSVAFPLMQLPLFHESSWVSQRSNVNVWRCSPFPTSELGLWETFVPYLLCRVRRTMHSCYSSIKELPSPGHELRAVLRPLGASGHAGLLKPSKFKPTYSCFGLRKKANPLWQVTCF